MTMTTSNPTRPRFVPPPSLFLAPFLVLSVALIISSAGAQTVPPLPPTAKAAADDQAVLLSPFEVTASSDMGYQATETLAGTRLKTELKDVATQVNVMTKEFLEDLAITDLDDAMQYSLNTETRFEAIDVNNTGFGNDDSINVIGGGQGGRTRGLSAPNNSHDFFDTFVRMDSYNTERFTFASGPNSILFGNSSPSGTIDTTFKRARTDKPLYELSSRANPSTGGVRWSTDLNQPIIRNKLALRVDGLMDRDKDWRKPAYKNQDRLYTALTYTPYRWVTIRAYNERGRVDQQVAKATILQDHVTPWILAGKPLFNNYIVTPYPNNALPAGSPVVVGGVTTVPSIGSISGDALRRPNAPIRPIISYDMNGFLGFPIVQQSNMALGIGYNDLIASPNNLERSIIDPNIYPFNRSFNGEASHALYYTTVRGGSVELNPFRNFFIELAGNEEKSRSRAAEFMDGRTYQLQVDPNMYLNDRITPNPMAGRIYVEDAFGGANSNTSKNYGAKKQQRASLSYELNFENHTGWTKWLGLHRLAGLYDHLESTLVRETSLFTVSPTTVGTYSFVTSAGNSTLPGFRYYFTPEKDNWSIKLPFDPMQDGLITQPGWVDANGRQVYGGVFDPAVEPITPSFARNKVDSTAFVTQSYLINRRLVLSYGRRRDAVDIFGDPVTRANWNFDELLDSIKWQKVRHEVPINTVKSAVLHPLPWVSFAYSETTTKQVRSSVIQNPDGSIAETGAGVGKDYGITLRLSNTFSVRINKYDDVGLGNSSSVANGVTPTAAAAGNFGPNLKVTTAALERSIQVNAPDFDPANPMVAPPSTLSPRWAYYQQDLARVTNPTAAIGGEISGRYTVNSDSVAHGYELTLIANPTQNWRIAVTGAKNTASESNIGGQWWDFIKERMPIWASAANLAGGATPGTTLNKIGIPTNVVAATANSGLATNYRTYSQVIAAALANYQYISDSEGKLNNNIRTWRFNGTTRYAFSRGTMKGVFVGANYLWRSPAAVGYPIKTAAPTFITVPGVSTSEVSVSDSSRPYRGGSLMSFDGFVGYSRRLMEGKTLWRVQLNIRNLLDRDGLLVQRVTTDGTGINFVAQQPRSFVVTNTFSF